MATYVPNAEQLTEPTSSRMVGSAAEEFRVLKTSVDVRADSLEADVDVLLADMSQAQDDIDVLQNQMTAVGLGTDSVALAANLASTASGKGAALVGCNDAGGFWAGTTAEAQLQEIGPLLVNVVSMGGDATGATASDAAMAAAFAKSNYVIVPTGSIICLDSMLTLAANQVLWIGANATVKRRSAAASTDPVIWMNRKSSAVWGAGPSSIVTTEKACPNGVIRIGAADMTTPIGVTDNLWCAVRDLTVEGGFGVDGTFTFGQSAGNPDIGILINAPQIDTLGATVIGNQASYFHQFHDLVIRKLNYGITARGYANGLRGSNIHFERLGSSGIRGRALDFNGGGESCFVNCWHHFSPYSDGIYARSTTANTITYGPIGNCVLTFMSEPGNSGAAKMYDINGEGFMITGQNYLTTAPTYVGNHTINVLSPAHGAADINVFAGSLRVDGTNSAINQLFVAGASGQTSNIVQVRNSAGTGLFNVDPSGNADVLGIAVVGNIRVDSAPAGAASTVTFGNTTQTTVGAAGPASALPATPEFYLRFFSGTTEYVIPAYKRV